MITKIEKFFFSLDPLNLIGLARIGICYCIIEWWVRAALGHSKTISAMGQNFPPYSSILNILQLPSISATDFYIPLLFILYLLAWIVCFGLLLKITLPMITVLFFYLAADQSSWGYNSHASISIAFFLLVACFAPGVDSWSLPRVWQAFKNREGWQIKALIGKPKAKWGLQVLCFVLIGIYFATGVSKLRHGSYSWLSGKTLAFVLSDTPKNELPKKLYFSGPHYSDSTQGWRDGFGIEYFHYKGRITAFGKRISENRILMAIMSIFTIIFELGVIAYFFGAWWRVVVPLAMVGFHIGTTYTMNLTFRQQIIIALCIIDYPFLWSRIQHHYYSIRQNLKNIDFQNLTSTRGEF